MTDPRLALLRDIQAAPEPGWWPPAIGWWLLALLLIGLLVLLVLLGRQLRRGWQRRRRRQRVLRELDTLYRRHAGRSRELASAVSSLLRRAALLRFPAAMVAGLRADDWLAFLERTGEPGFADGPGRVLAEAPYRPGVAIDEAALYRLARRWLERNL